MGTLLRDLKYAARMLAKSPGFTTVAILTLALGIGANTAIFSVVDAVLLRPLPVRDPGRLVVLHDELPKLNLPRTPVSALQYRDYSAHTNLFESTAALVDENVNLTGSGHPRRLQATRATAMLFPLLGVRPILGRSFTPADDAYGSPHVALLGYSLWHGAFGADPHVVGESVHLDGISYQVIGVLPETLDVLYPHAEIWMPMDFSAQAFSEDSRWSLGLTMLARLRPGVTLARARAEMAADAARIVAAATAQDPTHASIVASFGIEVRPLMDEKTGDLRSPLYILLGAVFLVLLIACANIAGLLLARAGARSREMNVRAALGATRARIVAQTLTESLLLSLIGGAAGFLLAGWGVAALIRFAPPTIPHPATIALDARVLVFTFAVSLVCGVLFGLAPALHGSRPALSEALKEGGRSLSQGTARHRLRRALIAGEVALTFVLLVSSGLLLRSLQNLLNVKPGFDPSNVLLMRTQLPMAKYAAPGRIPAFAQALLAGARSMPGVQSAAVSADPPLSPESGAYNSVFTIPGYQRGPNRPQPHADVVFASPAYFSVLRIALLRGRLYTQAEMNQNSVVVIDDALARLFWPNEDAIGKRLDVGPGEETIVGVVAAVRSDDLATATKGTIYRAVYSPDMTLMVRATSNPLALALAPALRRQIESLDSDQPVFEVGTMQQLVDASLAQRRFAAALLGLFAVLALILAAIGLNGVIAYLVFQRTHEIGIRMALGAQSRDVLHLILREGLGLLLAGLAAGIAGAFALTRLLASLLYGVKPQDPATIACVGLVLSAVAVLSCYIPARRAMRVDPVIALRSE